MPTFNYIAIHFYGDAEIIKDEKELIRMLDFSVKEREKENGDHYKLKELRHDFLNVEMKGLVGFSIRVEQVLANFKLSQNREQTGFKNVIKELKKTDCYQSIYVANQMEKIEDTLFGK